MSKPPAAGKPSGCPICRKPAAPRFVPFCSARCGEIDLGRWFGESYRVPAGAAEELPSDDDLPG
jgi:endogenous inhibitor of DNA gyrase (YacG/DUF329 family)